ncbi:MAG TPA: hypothetical protein VFZ66_05375 [Herpetosiphonaceae bacterium]
MQTAKRLQSGPGQMVELPEEFRFEGDHVLIKRMGSAVVLLPCQDPWQALFESLDQFSGDFIEQREQPE